MIDKDYFFEFQETDTDATSPGHPIEHLPDISESHDNQQRHAHSQTRKKYTGFQTRFLFVLATILIIFSGLTVSTIYHHEMKNLEENAHEKTELIMKSIEANTGLCPGCSPTDHVPRDG